MDVAAGKARQTQTHGVGGWVQPTNTGPSLTGRNKKVVRVGTTKEWVGMREVEDSRGKELMRRDRVMNLLPPVVVVRTFWQRKM